MAASRPLILACQDTALDAVMLQAYGDAFARSTGRAISVDNQRYSYDAVADMVDDGATRWDVCRTDATECALLGRAGLLAMIDWKLVDRKAAPANFTVPWWGMPGHLYSYVLAYDRKALTSAVPNGWRDMWDTTTFPGKRLLSGGSVTGVCEAALLSTGLDPGKLYPLDVDQALERLKLLRDQMVFAPDEAACADALMQGQGTMAFMRSTTAHMLRQRSAGRIDFTWIQAILAPSLMFVPKEAPSGDDAMRFIAVTQDPAVQVKLLQFAGCGPVNPVVEGSLSPELAALDPGSPAHRMLGVAIDAPWYLGNLRSLQPRWTAFTAG